MSTRTAALIIGIIIIVTLGFSTYAATAAFHQSHVNAKNADEKNRRDMLDDYTTCLRGNDSRSRIRRLVADELQIVFGNRTLSPEELRRGQAVIKRSLIVLPPVDCPVLHPPPPNLTAAEKARLPHFEPIPRLKL